MVHKPMTYRVSGNPPRGAKDSLESREGDRMQRTFYYTKAERIRRAAVALHALPESERRHPDKAFAAVLHRYGVTRLDARRYWKRLT